MKFCQNCEILRAYNKLFSPFENHVSACKYTQLSLPFIVRKRLAQIRLGVLPIRIESDRYARDSVAAELRFCKQPNCVNQTGNSVYLVEDEMHFMLHCKQYANLRSDLFQKVNMPGFSQLTDHLQFKHLLTCDNLARFVGQYIIEAFDQRLVT